MSQLVSQSRTAKHVREAFLAFYRERGHRVLKGSPIVPKEDPTLLFTSAGMVQFKKNYSTREPLEFRRVATIQKCLRATDLESVGLTPRHLTFFEMLGHFSFGDYFKREAIHWNWELFTKVLGLPVEKLKVSVYLDDDEAFEIWEKEIGLSPDRIYRLGKEDNFWGPAGESGACGPCSEVYYDLGEDLDPDPRSGPGSPTDRWIEIGNFVFPQFDMQPDKTMAPLANRGIDTGIGLERLTLVLEGKRSVFHTSIFTPIIQRIEEMSGREYGGGLESAFHVIADHIRTLTFALTEGVLPSNEGRGYVIRRILRRAAVQGHRLGLDRPFLTDLCETVVAEMEDPYREIREALPAVKAALRGEEERFAVTLSSGLGRFEEAEARVRRDSGKVIPGEVVFQLYDTYGFPTDLTEVLARERGLTVDQAGFQTTMEEQRERSRSRGRFQQAGSDGLTWRVLSDGAHSAFRGYETLELEARVRRFAAIEPTATATATASRRYWIVLEETPFYAESGGQVGDRGLFVAKGFAGKVLDTLRVDDEIRHRVEVESGTEPPEVVEAKVDAEARHATMRNHTATHLLHAALRTVLGAHVTQAGSLVAPDRLRFDFTHSKALTAEEIRQVEDLVNGEIVLDTAVRMVESSYDDAIKEGVMALFGEKYGDLVRRIEVAEFSRELCGGTHVTRSGQIGAFLVLSESGIAAGTRRLEAISGLGAIREARRLRDTVDQIRRLVPAAVEELPARVGSLQEDITKLKREVKELKTRGASDVLADFEKSVVTRGSARVFVGDVQLGEGEDVRALGDQLRVKLGQGAALAVVHAGVKITILAVVTKDLVERGLSAADIVRTAASAAGGKGGGKPDLAMSGVGDPSLVDAAREAGRAFILGSLD